MSTLEEMFARLQEVATRREQEQEAERAVDTPWEARAPGASGSASTGSGPGSAIRAHANGAQPECRCGNTGGIFVDIAGGRRRYVVCPACDPRPGCKRCDGTGHGRRFNLVTQMEDVVPFGCPCTSIPRDVARLNETGIPDRYLSSDFDTLSYDHLAPEPREKLRLISEWSEAYCELTAEVWKRRPHELEKPFLTFMGPVGTGKTHLAVAALKRFVGRHGMTGRFVDFSRFLGELRHCYSAKTSEEAVLGPLRAVDVLLIDELGKGRTENEWQLEKLDDLINSRYNGGKVTLLTTNYLHAEFRYDPKRFGLGEIPANESFWRQPLQERIGLRMYDRLLEASEFLVFLGVESYRRRMLDELSARTREPRRHGQA
jgi:DNA replication protein DnaC